MELTQSLLKELLNYDPHTGVFTWNRRDRKWFKADRVWKTWNTRYSGNKTGCPNSEGYLLILLFGRPSSAHRLAWMYMAGHFPENQIDHINGDRADNRYENLRCVTGGENQKNRAMGINNTSGQVGVFQQTGREKWSARTYVGGKCISLGTYKTKTEAIAAKKAGEREYGFHVNHGRNKCLV